MTNCRQDFHSYAVVLELARRHRMCAAVDGNFVPARYQSGRKVFGECFKATVASRYTSRSENGYSHLLSLPELRNT